MSHDVIVWLKGLGLDLDRQLFKSTITKPFCRVLCFWKQFSQKNVDAQI
jgi:hypothetical protein